MIGIKQLPNAKKVNIQYNLCQAKGPDGKIMTKQRSQFVAETNTHESSAAEFWSSIEHLRGHLEVAEYKHLVLGILYLKSVLTMPNKKLPCDDPLADTLIEIRSKLWKNVLNSASTPLLAAALAAAYEAISENMPGVFHSTAINRESIARLLCLVDGLGANPSHNPIPDIFMFCLDKFNQAEGKRASEFYTPDSLIDLLVKTAAPSEGRIYDPCCGTGGLLIRACEHSGIGGPRLLPYGQESNPSTWCICKMNLAIRGIQCDIGSQPKDSLNSSPYSDFSADYILANPPFNADNWTSEPPPERKWEFGIPPASNANFAWIQHIFRHLSPGGTAVFTMGNGALSSNTCGEGEIRRRMIEADVVDCIIALPPNLFHSTRIPASVWVLAENKGGGVYRGCKSRDRRHQTLFIDARRMGVMANRIHRVLRASEINEIATAYRAWRGSIGASYMDVAGFSRSCGKREIEAAHFVLNPGRYVGSDLSIGADESPHEKIEFLTRQLDEQFKESIRLRHLISERMGRIG